MNSQKDFYRHLATKIRDVRINFAHLSQQQLADSIGLSRAAIANIERGRQQVLAHTLYAIAVVCNVPVQKFFPHRSRTEKTKFDKDVLKKELKNKVSNKDVRTILKKFDVQEGSHE